MIQIAYYISSHGFGHAARQQAVINQLAERGANVHVRTGAPERFFQRAASYHNQRYDIGLIQHDAMHFDVEASLRWMADFIQNQDNLIAQEVAFVRAQNIQLVVTDMPPIACQIASAAQIPSVAITHFTWDWVYAHYMDDFPQYRYLIDHIRAGYARTTLALQMQHPLPHAFDMFPRVEPIPLVFNPATHSKAQTYADFDIPANHKVGLLSMGGHDWSNGNLSAIKQMKDWFFLVTPGMWEQVKDDPDHFRAVSHDIDNYHNLIAHSDVVVGKAGGSTVAEVLGHRTPMIYTTQHHWREAQLLDTTLRQFAVSAHVTAEDFAAGNWVEHLEPLVSSQQAWPSIATNGAPIAAERILAMV